MNLMRTLLGLQVLFPHHDKMDLLPTEVVVAVAAAAAANYQNHRYSREKKTLPQKLNFETLLSK